MPIRIGSAMAIDNGMGRQDTTPIAIPDRQTPGHTDEYDNGQQAPMGTNDEHHDNDVSNEEHPDTGISRGGERRKKKKGQDQNIGATICGQSDHNGIGQAEVKRRDM